MAIGASDEAEDELLLELLATELLDAELLDAGICTGLSVFKQSLQLPAPAAAIIRSPRPAALST